MTAPTCTSWAHINGSGTKGDRGGTKGLTGTAPRWLITCVTEAVVSHLDSGDNKGLYSWGCHCLDDSACVLGVCVTVCVSLSSYLCSVSVLWLGKGGMSSGVNSGHGVCTGVYILN